MDVKNGQDPTPLTTTRYYYSDDHPHSVLSAVQHDHVSNGMYGGPGGDYGHYNEGNINEQS
jgi:hypothetical protein